MNLLSESNWLHRHGVVSEFVTRNPHQAKHLWTLSFSDIAILDAGGGLEDLEDILSAPCPALGTPLKQAHRGHEGHAGQLLQPAACISQIPAVQQSPQEHLPVVNGEVLEGGGADDLSLPAIPPLDQDSVSASSEPPISKTGDQLLDKGHHLSRPPQTEVDRSQTGQLCAQLQGCTVATLASSSAICNGRIPEDSACPVHGSSQKGLWQSIHDRGSYEGMTIAASLLGAVAGGAAAGPLGLSLGAFWNVKSDFDRFLPRFAWCDQYLGGVQEQKAGP